MLIPAVEAAEVLHGHSKSEPDHSSTKAAPTRLWEVETSSHTLPAETSFTAAAMARGATWARMHASLLNARPTLAPARPRSPDTLPRPWVPPVYPCWPSSSSAMLAPEIEFWAPRSPPLSPGRKWASDIGDLLRGVAATPCALTHTHPPVPPAQHRPRCTAPYQPAREVG